MLLCKIQFVNPYLYNVKMIRLEVEVFLYVYAKIGRRQTYRRLITTLYQIKNFTLVSVEICIVIVLIFFSLTLTYIGEYKPNNHFFKITFYWKKVYY